jgi:hypothetical protein
MARSQENSNATDHHDRPGSSSATGFVRLGQRQALETVIHWAEPPPSPQSTGAIGGAKDRSQYRQAAGVAKPLSDRIRLPLPALAEQTQRAEAGGEDL